MGVFAGGDRKRTKCICDFCKKPFTLESSKYKQRVKDNIGGKIYCSSVCSRAAIGIMRRKVK